MFDISFKKNYICRVKEHNAIKYFLLHLPFHKMSKRQYAKLFILMLTVNKAVSLLIRLFLAKKKKKSIYWVCSYSHQKWTDYNSSISFLPKLDFSLLELASG